MLHISFRFANRKYESMAQTFRSSSVIFCETQKIKWQQNTFAKTTIIIIKTNKNSCGEIIHRIYAEKSNMIIATFRGKRTVENK